ncbi:MAG: sigma-54 dependent transcriptional regulator [Planctomycetota bacterium]
MSEPTPLKILVVDDKPTMRDSVGLTLQRAGYAVVAAASGQQALQLVDKHDPAAVITDLCMPGMTGIELLGHLTDANPQRPVVLMTAYGEVNTAVEAMKLGAFDFVQKPFEGDQLVSVLRRAVDQKQTRTIAPAPPVIEQPQRKPPKTAKAKQSCDLPNFIGDSAPMRNVAAQVRQIADSQGTVLIQGESGAGKEVVARALHALSPRRDRVMLCLNCAALSSSLLESELFGHERGAFTGADQLRKGRFELADGGTLLLDEISEIGPTLQAKLLRVLQEGQFERVGASQTRKVDVRVIATTNRDLTRSVADGTFRQDLYYRLNVLPIGLPPLRDRLDDVPALAEHFLEMAARREGKPAKTLTAEALALFQAHPWPGNVRELQNLCERANVLSPGDTIDADVLRPWLIPASAFHTPAAPAKPSLPTLAAPVRVDAGSSDTPASPTEVGSPTLQLPASFALPHHGDAEDAFDVRPLEDAEREHVLAALEHFDGNRTRTAEALGIGLRTLGLKLKKWKQQNLVAAGV